MDVVRVRPQNTFFRRLTLFPSGSLLHTDTNSKYVFINSTVNNLQFFVVELVLSMKVCFFRENDIGHGVKCKQITYFTRFSENRGKTCEIKREEFLNIFE